jgi:ribosomal protein S12 methylthiotransferase accessory factor
MINKLREFLANLNLSVDEQVFSPTKNVYLAKLTDFNTNFSSFGKGESKEEALLSAYGEMCERLITRNYFEEYYINGLYPDMKNSDFLNEELKHFYKIDELTKEDLIDFNSDKFEILSIPFLEKDTAKTVYFPINIIQNLYASNGMAFHFDLREAYYNAKTEIIERFVKFDVIRYALPLPKISHPLNSSKIQIYDATLDGRYPVMAASFIEDDEIILSFGCDLNREVAIKKAYLELWQTELKERGRFNENIEEVKSSFNLYKHFANLSGDVHTNFLKAPLFKEAKWQFNSLDVFKEKEYIKVYEKNPFLAVRIIIPGISEVYPLQDLIYNNINQGKLYYRDKILNYEKYSDNEIYEIIDELKYSFATEIGALIGVIFEKPIFADDFEYCYKNNIKPKFAKRYKNILNLARKLNEI